MMIFVNIMVVILGFIGFYTNAKKDLSSSLLKLEQEVSNIAANINLAYQNRCKTNQNECRDSHFSCPAELYSDLICMTDFPLENCDGQQGSTNYSSVQFGKYNFTMTNQKVLNKVQWQNQSIQEMICAFEDFDNQFAKLQESYQFIREQILGTYNGVFRNYPFLTKCLPYELRYQSQYCEVAQVRKNLIIVLDRSWGMDQQIKNGFNAFQLGKELAKQLIRCSSYNDFIQVILLNQRYEKVLQSTLDQANEQLKTKLYDKISTLTNEGGFTDFNDAFNQTYLIFKQFFREQPQHISKESSIVLITSTGKIKMDEKINEIIKQQIDEIDASIFIYQLGALSENSVQDLSCQINAYWKNVNGDEDFFLILNDFYQYLAQGARLEPMYTNNFKNFSLINASVFLSIPLVDRSVNPLFLFGVYSVEIEYRKLSEFINTRAELAQYINNKIPPPGKKIENRVSIIRSLSKAKCSNILSIEPIQQCQFNFTPFHNVELGENIKSKDIVCGCSENGCNKTCLILVTVIPIVGTLLIVIIVMVICYRQKIKEICLKTLKRFQKQKSSQQQKPVYVDPIISNIKNCSKQQYQDEKQMSNIKNADGQTSKFNEINVIPGEELILNK